MLTEKENFLIINKIKYQYITKLSNAVCPESHS